MLIVKAIEIKTCVGLIYRYVTNVMCTLLTLRHVLDYCAFSTWECLSPEEVTNIYHFCYNLQLNLGRRFSSSQPPVA